jgi:hypothetical protein
MTWYLPVIPATLAITVELHQEDYGLRQKVSETNPHPNIIPIPAVSVIPVILETDQWPALGQNLDKKCEALSTVFFFVCFAF